MSVPSDKYADIVSLTYMKADDQDPNHPASAGPKANGIEVLRVRFEYDGEYYVHDIPNGNFRLDNPALQFMAYIRTKPSEFDGQSYKPSGHISVPVVRDGENSYALSNEALEVGAETLEKVVWSPDLEVRREDESDTDASQDGSDSDDDDGEDDKVEVENDPEEDGLTVHVE